MNLIIDISLNLATITEEKRGLASAFMFLMGFLSIISVVYLVSNIKRRSSNAQIKLPNLDINNIEKEIKPFVPITPITVDLVDPKEDDYITSKSLPKENESFFKKALPFETKSIMSEDFPTSSMPVLEKLQVEEK